MSSSQDVKEEAANCELDAAAPALDMILDEYWFFNNTLKAGRASKPPFLPKSPSPQSKCGDRPEVVKVSIPTRFSSRPRRLLRTPSLPPSRVGLEEVEEAVDQEQEEVDDLNWSKIYEGVLRTTIARGGGGRSLLTRAPSMPIPSSSTDDRGREEETAVTKSTPSLSRLRHAYSSLESHCHPRTPTKARTPGTSSRERSRARGDVRSFSASHQPSISGAGATSHKKALFQEKKWKSSSDLESIEVQGFKDLGFVFDKVELRESLADVLPGLRDKKATARAGDGDGNVNVSGDGVRRPYLSEAWHHEQRSAPPAIRLQADRRSAAEMKDQIRQWAQAVACNVRQEC